MTRLSYKTLFLIIALLLIPIIFLLRLQQKPSQSILASWWNESWTYRQAINISTHSIGETNVYIITTINIGTTAKSQPDNGDFRFIDQSGQLLDYYISANTGTTAPTFHILFPNFPSGAQTIYTYYGNQSASNGFSSSPFTTQASNYTIGSPVTEETGSGPVAWWKFDEGVGTSAFDSSGQNNHGVFGSGTSAPTWNTENQCISGKCLKFSNNNYLTSYNIPITQLSVCLWLKTNNSNSTTNDQIIGKYDMDQAQRVFSLTQNATTNYIGFTTSSNGSYQSGNDVTSTIAINDNKWHHLCGVYDTTYNRLYIDGKLHNSTNRSNNGLYNINEKIAIGSFISADTPVANSFFNGFLDDIKIYPYARSASQIKADYTSGLAGQSSSNSSTNMGEQSAKGLSDGLVAYYKFDEGVGTTTADSSGNSNLATFATGTSAPSWSSGKYGVGLSFEGNGQNASTTTQLISGTNPTFSYSLWVKAQNSGNNPQDILAQSRGGVNNNASYEVVYYTNTKNICLTDGGGGQINCHPYDLGNSWTHLSIVNDYQNNTYHLYINGSLIKNGSAAGPPIQALASQFKIGNHPYYPYAKSFSGLIDELRIYNRALSPDEVKDLYEYAPGPIGYWKFEEASGTTAHDSSGSNRHATIQNGAVFSNGKYGKALGLNLNGPANQWASFTSLSHNYGFTKSAWIYPISTSQCGETRCSVIGPYFEILSNLQYYDNNLSPVGWKTGGSIPLNQWSYITVSNDNSFLKLFVNGIQVQSVGITNTGTHSSNAIGAYGSNSRNFHGLIDEVKIYNYARTQSQILEDMNVGSGSKKPIVHYKFDEGQGTLVNNSGVGGTINGTFGSGSSSPTWAEGKFNKALSFDGNGDYLITADNDALDITGPVTMSFWIKSNDVGNRALFEKGNNDDLMFQAVGSTAAGIFYLHSLSSTTAPPTATQVIFNNQWHHIVTKFDGTNKYLYVDGVLYHTNAATTPTANSSPFTIGSRSGAYPFTGLIDEVKIYNYALSADEIKQDYNQDSTTKIGQSSQTIGATTTNLEYCIPGDASTCSAPIAEWKFEEGTGTTAFDSSGTSIHNLPLLTGDSSPTWSNGKIGKSLYFDGNDAIGYNNSSIANITGPITVNAWVKTNSGTSGGIACRYGNSGSWTYCLYMNASGKLIFLRSSYTDSWSNAVTSNSSINNNQWHYVTGRFDGSTMKVYVDSQEDGSVNETRSSNSSLWSFCIGNQHYLCNGTGYNGHFTGSIDHVRIYNYARTPAQIAYDYNKGEPIAWWKLDECQGATAYDSSGMGHNGTINIGASGPQTSVGTCTTSGAWFNGATGKNNSSLNFDGTDDEIGISDSNIPSGSSHRTISLWIKPNAIQNKIFFGYGTVANLQLFSILLSSAGNAGIWWNSNSPDTDFPTTKYTANQWNHLTYTYDGTNIISYVNGEKKDTVVVSLNTVKSGTLHLGNGDAAGWASSMKYFSGQLDDVRIYNYALTSTQVKTLYNGGALNFQ